mgnify:CR=1 FL=1
MNIFDSNKLFSLIIKYIDIKDFFNLSLTNRKNFNNFKSNKIWIEKLENIINPNIKSKIVDYKRQFFLNYYSSARNICSICNGNIIKDFYLTVHKCHYGFIQCVKCNSDIKCNCNNFNTYHTKCIIHTDNYIICPICNNNIIAYKIGLNI